MLRRDRQQCAEWNDRQVATGAEAPSSCAAPGLVVESVETGGGTPCFRMCGRERRYTFEFCGQIGPGRIVRRSWNASIDHGYYRARRIVSGRTFAQQRV